MSSRGLDRLIIHDRTCRYCNIDELPDDFVSVVNKYNPHLLELDLTSNQLTRLPADLHELKSLRALRVKYNKIPEFPAVCFRLEQCMVLDLAGNQIDTVPDDIVRLRSLRELDLSGNRISEVTGFDQREGGSGFSISDSSSHPALLQVNWITLYI